MWNKLGVMSFEWEYSLITPLPFNIFYTNHPFRVIATILLFFIFIIA